MKLEVVCVPKARFQVSLGCRPVSEYHSLKKNRSFDAQGCYDRVRW